MTGFVGRHSELAEVGQLSRGVTVVTICGTGGCGKTRLAVEVAREQLGEHAGGAWFVDLSAVTSPGLVASAIATATGRPAAMTDVGRLVQELSEQSMLLVLDNCEHLVDEVARVVHAIVRDCARLRVLASSREPLGIESEWVYRLAGLTEADSMQLFVERAQRADAGFALDEPTTATVAKICRRLDGLPLALELAAAHAGTMAPADILARLDRPLLLLVGGHSTVPRHRTIQAALAWSEAMLSAAERTLYRRLGLFVGGFDLEAAEAVVSGPDLPRADVVPLLRRLVERSLVQFGRGSDRGRYRLLEPIREHASGRLAEAGEAPAIIDAYVRHYSDVACAWSVRMLADSPAAPAHPRSRPHGQLRGSSRACTRGRVGGFCTTRQQDALGLAANASRRSAPVAGDGAREFTRPGDPLLASVHAADDRVAPG
jgi:predicted ATPase